mmetsp:Transcript_4312/g.13900  ORF Transcript_4312/g.13900 Transcript_4312/m.13900 type:complete len:1246 (-) Transcript_4312:278-4015(-)
MTHEINMLIISNREVHATLCAKLKLREVERKRDHRAKWEARMLAWRQLRHAHALGAFKLQLHEASTVDPPERASIIEALARQQASFQSQREETMASLGRIEPSELTAASAGAVRDQLVALGEEEAAVEGVRLDELRAAEDAMEDTQREAAEFLRGRLLHFGAIEAEQVEEILAREIEPVLRRRRHEALCMIDKAAAALRRQRRRLHEQALALAELFVRAGQIMDVQVAETALVGAAFRDDMADVRSNFERDDRAREAELEECLTRMRQAADKVELQVETDNAMAMLEGIQRGYQAMHVEAVGLVQKQPSNIARILDALQARLCTSMGLQPRAEYVAVQAVDGTAPVDTTADTPNDLEGAGEDGEIELHGETKALSLADEEEDLAATFGLVFPEKMKAEELLDAELAGLQPKKEAIIENKMLVVTANGVEWQMLTSEEVESQAGVATDVSSEAARFSDLASMMSKKERAERASLSGERASLSVILEPAELALRLRLDLACRCLSWHETHAAFVLEKAKAESIEMQESLTMELDERLMAHRPRPGQVETGTLADRDEELLAHRERFMRHVKAVRTRRATVQHATEAALDAWRKSETEHLGQLEKLRAALRNEKNVYAPTLLRLGREAEAAHASFLTSLDGRRDELFTANAGAMRALRDFNEGFVATWHGFGAGGNFNATEVERFRGRLDEQAAMAEAEAAAADEKAARLYDQLRAKADEAKAAFDATLELNLEDVRMLEGLRLRQGQATADMRSITVASGAQQNALDEAITKVNRLLEGLAGVVEKSESTSASASRLDAMVGSSLDVSPEAKVAAGALGKCGGEAALDAMWSLNELRKMVMGRARLLELLRSTTVPESLPPICLEPINEGEEPPTPPAAPPPMPGSDALGTGTLRDAIDAVRTRHEAGLIEYVEAYYTAKGEREITRPSLIPPSLDDFRAKVGDVLSEMVARAHADRHEAANAFRAQLATLKRTLSLLGPAVFETMAVGCRAAATRAAREIEAAHAPIAAELFAKREANRLALKPSLRSPVNRPQRVALEVAERDRYAAALAAAAALCGELTASEQAHADVLLRRLPHLTHLVLALLDSTLQPEDLSEAEAPPPPEIHYGIYKQMRMEAREVAIRQSEDPPMHGRPFQAHTWDGTPLKELRAPVEPASDGGEGGTEATQARICGVEAVDDASPPLTACFARPQRVAIAARDRVYAAYRSQFEERIQAIVKVADSTLRSEKLWAANFAKQMAMLCNAA